MNEWQWELTWLFAYRLRYGQPFGYNCPFVRTERIILSAMEGNYNV